MPFEEAYIPCCAGAKSLTQLPISLFFSVCNYTLTAIDWQSSSRERLRATKDENGGAQWSMINGQFSIFNGRAARNTHYATRFT